MGRLIFIQAIGFAFVAAGAAGAALRDGLGASEAWSVGTAFVLHASILAWANDRRAHEMGLFRGAWPLSFIPVANWIYSLYLLLHRDAAAGLRA
jgi:hypothetical protein